MKPFTHFVGIDWSGAKGKRHAGLVVAVCEANSYQVALVAPPSGKKYWSRLECSHWIANKCGLPQGARVLIGLDSAFSMPFLDDGAYLPDVIEANQAKLLWAHVDKTCCGADDLFGGPFVEKHAEHYLRTGNRGTKFRRRMRIVETLAVTSGAGPCESVFHLIGPSQVGLSGLSTMRMLNQLAGHSDVAVWPYDDMEEASVVLAEIYAAAFASLAGHRGKVRDAMTLKRVLSTLNATYQNTLNSVLSDHAGDALITAAALRHIAPYGKYWKPQQLSTMVRRTEGWVFGIL